MRIVEEISQALWEEDKIPARFVIDAVGYGVLDRRTWAGRLARMVQSPLQEENGSPQAMAEVIGSGLLSSRQLRRAYQQKALGLMNSGEPPSRFIADAIQCGMLSREYVRNVCTEQVRRLATGGAFSPRLISLVLCAAGTTTLEDRFQSTAASTGPAARYGRSVDRRGLSMRPHWFILEALENGFISRSDLLEALQWAAMVSDCDDPDESCRWFDWRSDAEEPGSCSWKERPAEARSRVGGKDRWTMGMKSRRALGRSVRVASSKR